MNCPRTIVLTSSRVVCFYLLCWLWRCLFFFFSLETAPVVQTAPAPKVSVAPKASAPAPGASALKRAPPQPSVGYSAPPAAAAPSSTSAAAGGASNASKIAELESMLADLGPSPTHKASAPRQPAAPSLHYQAPAHVPTPSAPAQKPSINPPPVDNSPSPLPRSGSGRTASLSVSKPAPSTNNDIVICGKCAAQITGTYISALDKNWHPDHFVCSSCSKSLDGNFFDTEKGILCTDCASEQLRCSECHKPITGTHLVYSDGRPVHNECVPKSSCGRCNNPLSLGDAHVEALDKLWHPECFACTRCMNQLGATFVQYEGTPYCQACIQILSKERNIVFKT